MGDLLYWQVQGSTSSPTGIGTRQRVLRLNFYRKTLNGHKMATIVEGWKEMLDLTCYKHPADKWLF